MKPFDVERAAFLLFALVIGTYVIIALMGVSLCLVYASDVVEGKWQCDKASRVADLLGTALSAVLGYIAGRITPKT